MAKKKVYKVEVYVPDGTEALGYRKTNEALQVSEPDPDAVKVKVRELLKTRGYTVRSLNFGTDNKVIAYTGPKGSTPQIGGWQYKKPPRSRPKL